jgi:hypothetical protein
LPYFFIDIVAYIQANLAFAVKLARSLAPLPVSVMGRNKVRILTSSSAAGTFIQKAKSKFKGNIDSLRDGIPTSLTSEEVCILISPSSRQDYQAAQQIASDGLAKAVVIVNGFAKVGRTNNINDGFAISLIALMDCEITFSSVFNTYRMQKV